MRLWSHHFAFLLLTGFVAGNCSKIDDLGSRFFAKTGAVKASGTVSGLVGQNLTLSVNGQAAIVNSATAEFSTSLTNGETFTLAVSAQPLGPGQLCTLTSETTGVVKNSLIPFAVQCSTGTNTIAGSITGLVGSGLQLQLNSGEIISASGAGFSFATKITDGQAYNVQVKVQPSAPVQICTPEYNVGVIAGAHVTNVSILCSTVPYSVGGYVNGLANGSSVTVQINGGQNTARTSDGFFLFPTPLADQTHYDVTVLTQPTGQTCSVQGGSGAIDGRGSYATYIQCSSAAWTVSGIVSGLNGGYVTLVTSAGEYKPVVADGAFSFTQKFAGSSAFAVEVFRNPLLPAQTCTVMNGTGTNISADYGSVSVTCSSTGYTVGGSVTGLTASGLVLRLNGTSDLIVPVGSSSYTFADSVATGGTYSVSVAAQPTGLKCTATPATASGTVSTANVTSVAVTCQSGYTVGGTVTGLNGNNFVLRNTINGGTSSDFVISGSSFTFPELLIGGDTYSVQILNHPESPYQTCGISNSGGTIASANVTNVVVSCTNVVVQFAAASSNGFEATQTIPITINITPASARPLNLTLALAAGTAASGVDFNFLTPTINVAVGATSVDAQIDVFDDAAYEPDETVILNLTNVDKAALGTTLNHTYTIKNNDGVTATKLVVTNSGSNFTAGGSTSITVQVQDALNNLATTDNATQIRFVPSTPTATVASMSWGTSCSGCGVAGGTAVVTVSGGYATIVLNDTKAESFQITIDDNAGPLTDPSPVALTTSAGAATQVVVTSAPGAATAGGTSTLTVQIQDVNGNVVTAASTQLTITPSSGGKITGVTTGSGDGSYGVTGGAENINVVGGVATITLTNTVAETYSIAITDNGPLTDPGSPNVTVSPAAASQLVLSSPASDFLTGATTTLTVQVRDTYGNVRSGDNATQVTFTPSTSTATITGASPGVAIDPVNVPGAAVRVTVVAGVATITLTDTVAETFTVSFAAASISVPSPDSITTSSGASKIAITQAGGSFTAGQTTTLTVQVQTASGTLVNTDNSTVVTFTPNNLASITAVTGPATHTTPPFDGANAPESVQVSGGVATITLTSNTVGTFQVSASSVPVLTPPANDTITVNGTTGAVITKAEYFDLNHDGKLDHLKVTFDKNVNEATLPGGAISTLFIAGYSNITRDATACIDESYPPNFNCTDPGESTNTATDNVVWLQFDPGPVYDTGATPDFTGADVPLQTVAGQGGCYIFTAGPTCATPTAADFDTTKAVETDRAPPVFVAAWADPIIDAWQVKLQFSEAVDLSSGVAACSGTVTNAAFTYNDVSGSGASALRGDFADNDPCNSTNGNYYVIPRVNARFTMSDLRTDTLALVPTFYDSLGQGTIATTKVIGYDPNLELYYPVDAAAPVNDINNTTVHDVTANNRHGAITGAVRVRDMGENNYSALKFDGSSYITVSGYAGVTGQTSRTVSAWVWSDHGYYNNPNHNRCNIMQWGGGAAFGIALNHEGSNPGGLMLLAGTSLQNKTNKPAVAGDWMHVAITWADDGTPSGADAILYINGVAQAVVNAGGSINTAVSGSVILGKSSTASDSFFRGKMDEVRLYSRALSASEIKKLATKVPGGLVVQYPLNDNSGTFGSIVDASGNGITSINNAATWTTDRYGLANEAMSFSAQSISADGSKLPLGSSDRTICAWALTNSLPASNTAKSIVGYGVNGTNTRISLSIANPSGHKLVLNTATTNFFYTNYTMPIGSWVHFCASTTGSSTAVLYINGEKFSPATNGSPSVNVSSGSILIGTALSGGYDWDGKIDDVRVYNRVLTAGEVAALATELDRGLVAYYPLDDNVGAGGTISDYSGSGYNGTLPGTSTPTAATDHNGVPLSAYKFNNKEVPMTTGANLPTGGNPVTGCAWFKFNSQQNNRIFTYGATAAVAGNAFGLASNTGYVPGFNGGSGGTYDAYSPLAGSLTRWSHLCNVYDGATTMQVFVDGNLELTKTLPAALTSTTAVFYLGSNANTATFFDGWLDDARIYNRRLSLAEIRAMSGFYPAHAANLAIWFDASRIGDTGNLNPADGSIFDNWKDLSLNGFDATRGNPSGNKPTFYSNVINGLPAIRYAGGQYVENSSFARNLNTTPHTQLSVFRASGGGAITGQKSGGGNHYRYASGPVLRSEIGGATSNSSTAYVNNTPTIGGLTYSNPNGVFYRNGAADGSFSQTAASTTSTWTFGGNDNGTTPNLTGDISEITIYDRVLTSAELEKLSCYYNRKYAIAVTGLVCE